MTAPARPPIAAPPQRAWGEVRLSAKAAGGRTRLDGFRQAGSLKALFPRPAGDALEAVLLNTAGGLTGGDRMAVEAEAGAGARLQVSTQAAERGYRALGESRARVEARLRVRAGGRLDWLPQETILFDGARIERRLSVDLEGDGTALLVEPVLWGRLARGEELREGLFHDRWDLRRDGRLLWAERFRIEGGMGGTLDRAGVGGGARAMATVAFAGAGAEGLLPKVRALLPPAGGASLLEDGLLVVRLLAADGFGLRGALIPIITALTGTALPKVWRL